MPIVTLVTAGTIGTISCAVGYFIAKDDQRKIKESFRAYTEHHLMDFTYRYQERAYIIQPVTFEELTKMKVAENEKTIACKLYVKLMDEFEKVYSFQYDKEKEEFLDLQEVFINMNPKNKELKELKHKLVSFILSGEWKSQLYTEEKKQTVKKAYKKVQEEADVDIRHHLDKINQRITWLRQSNLLEIEESHKVDVLQKDANRIVNTYHSLREETKAALKEKLIQGLIEINAKLNQLSIVKEEQLVMDMEKTINLIQKR